MADSQRLAVLKALTAHLKGITPANGYVAATWGVDYDLSTSVFRGRSLFGEGDPLPLVSILESPRSDAGLFAGEGNRARKEEWSLLIQGWAADDVANPTDPAYGLMDVVEHRLLRLTAVSTTSGDEIYPGEYLLGRSVADVAILPGVVRPPMEQVSSKAFFYLPVRITLVRASG